MTEGPLLLSIKAIAEDWGVSYNQIAAMVRRGELASVQVGRRRFVPRVEANRWLRAHYHAAANESQDAGEVVNLLEHPRNVG